MFWAEIRKITYTPVNPSFTTKKWGLRGSKLYRHVFVMEVKMIWICPFHIHLLTQPTFPEDTIWECRIWIHTLYICSSYLFWCSLHIPDDTVWICKIVLICVTQICSETSFPHTTHSSLMILCGPNLADCKVHNYMYCLNLCISRFLLPFLFFIFFFFLLIRGANYCYCYCLAQIVSKWLIQLYQELFYYSFKGIFLTLYPK